MLSISRQVAKAGGLSPLTLMTAIRVSAQAGEKISSSPLALGLPKNKSTVKGENLTCLQVIPRQWMGSLSAFNETPSFTSPKSLPSFLQGQYYRFVVWQPRPVSSPAE
jgi:hypothetical protein